MRLVPAADGRREGKRMNSPAGLLPHEQESYDRYIASLEPCPGCGRVDEMDNIEGRSLCAACSLDESDEWCHECGERDCCEDTHGP